MDDEHEHEGEESCPLCQGQFSDDLVRKIKSAKPMGNSMTAAEFSKWLSELGSDDPPLGEEPSVHI